MTAPDFDLVLRGGTVYDGSGAAPYAADVAVIGGRLAQIGDLGARRGALEVDAANLKLRDRGRLVPGYYADVAVFDPARVRDRAAFAQPHQYAEGMVHVLVNGVPVIRDGEHTGLTPGRVVRGPGWRSARQ